MAEAAVEDQDKGLISFSLDGESFAKFKKELSTFVADGMIEGAIDMAYPVEKDTSANAERATILRNVIAELSKGGSAGDKPLQALQILKGLPEEKFTALVRSIVENPENTLKVAGELRQLAARPEFAAIGGAGAPSPEARNLAVDSLTKAVTDPSRVDAYKSLLEHPLVKTALAAQGTGGKTELTADQQAIIAKVLEDPKKALEIANSAQAFLAKHPEIIALAAAQSQSGESKFSFLDLYNHPERIAQYDKILSHPLVKEQLAAAKAAEGKDLDPYIKGMIAQVVQDPSKAAQLLERIDKLGIKIDPKAGGFLSNKQIAEIVAEPDKLKPIEEIYNTPGLGDVLRAAGGTNASIFAALKKFSESAFAPKEFKEAFAKYSTDDLIDREAIFNTVVANPAKVTALCETIKSSPVLTEQLTKFAGKEGADIVELAGDPKLSVLIKQMGELLTASTDEKLREQGQSIIQIAEITEKYQKEIGAGTDKYKIAQRIGEALGGDGLMKIVCTAIAVFAMKFIDPEGKNTDKIAEQLRSFGIDLDKPLAAPAPEAAKPPTEIASAKPADAQEPSTPAVGG